MTDLITIITDEVGNKHIKSLISKNEWDNIFVVTTKKVFERLDIPGEINYILIEAGSSTKHISEQIIKGLKNKVKGLEVAVNFFSGSGKEHMALLGAILNIGLGIRLVKQGVDGIELIP